MKMKKAVLLFALCLMAGGVVQAQESEADPVQDAKEEVLDTVTEELNEAGEAGTLPRGRLFQTAGPTIRSRLTERFTSSP